MAMPTHKTLARYLKEEGAVFTFPPVVDSPWKQAVATFHDENIRVVWLVDSRGHIGRHTTMVIVYDQPVEAGKPGYILTRMSNTIHGILEDVEVQRRLIAKRDKEAPSVHP